MASGYGSRRNVTIPALHIKYSWLSTRSDNEQPVWIAADSNSGNQLADMYTGILGAAMISCASITRHNP